MSRFSSWRALGRRGPDGDARLSLDVARRLWPFLRPHLRFLLTMLGSVLATALLTAVPPLLYRDIIDRAIPQERLGLLTVLAVGVIGVAVANTVLQVLTRWATSHLGERVVFDLRRALFGRLQTMPFAFFTHTSTGAAVNRLTSDLAGGHRAFTATLASVVETVLGVAVTLTAMVVLDLRLTLLSLAVAPAFVVVTRRMRGRLHRLMDERLDAEADLSGWLHERFDVGGALLARLMGRAGQEQERFTEKAGRVRNVGVRTAVASRVFHGGFALVAAVGTGLVYWVGGRMVIDEAVTLGTIVAFAAYLTQLYVPLTMLANARVDLATALVSFQRVLEVLDLGPGARTGRRRLPAPRGRVVLEDVWFRYPAAEEVSPDSLRGGAPAPTANPGGRRWALQEVSMVVEPGQTVALVGPSGAGKTTTTLLVARLYEPTRGRITIDGHELSSLSEESLRRTVGMVTQEVHLFHDTVAANLRYARPGASDAELVAAARAARIHALVDSLPDGYDTLVGERGHRFSGGERQRLAIARLLLQDPAVVVLDEATAHLDSESEAGIQRALQRALAGRTSLVIAHRLSTVTTADRLVVLDGGRVVEEGTHAELLEAGGLYARLCRIQFAPRPSLR